MGTGALGLSGLFASRAKATYRRMHGIRDGLQRPIETSIEIKHGRKRILCGRRKYSKLHSITVISRTAHSRVYHTCRYSLPETGAMFVLSSVAKRERGFRMLTVQGEL
ncbi:hypothetical protein GYMLUDRAFT_36021 [Collybiopsis luxurians FD-317 M1]|nr:hypothetical protein GYMLUDRAFT_36021 [Collybiopsis luxurians FD-317 M1]